MSKLLIDDYPIQVLPKLAVHIGLNEAIILQQMHYWLSKSTHYHDDKKWIYNSYPKWQEQFPFWSEVTIKRTIKSLEKQKLLYVGNYNKAGFDKTKWYSVNYKTLEGMTSSSGQNDLTIRSKRTDGMGQNDQTNTIDYSEITTENKILSSDARPYKEIIDHLNMVTNKNYKHTTESTKKYINGRLDEGFTVDDFKQVINNKAKKWLGTDSEMYLRPKTLFAASNFEGYLNEEKTTIKDFNLYKVEEFEF